MAVSYTAADDGLPAGAYRQRFKRGSDGGCQRAAEHLAAVHFAVPAMKAMTGVALMVTTRSIATRAERGRVVLTQPKLTASLRSEYEGHRHKRISAKASVPLSKSASP
jgi:hypothetical protein